MYKRLKRLGDLTLDIAWAAMILLLPITSLPILSRLTGGTLVAPASIIPLTWLAIFWFIVYMIKKGTLPRESLPFLFFILVAFTASAFAFFLDIPTFKDQNILGEEITALLTLMIGAAFYMVTTNWLSQSRSRLTLTLKLVNVSGLILLLWALIQAFYIYLFQGNYPELLIRFQRIISIRDFFPGRMTGFAYEPSWLGQQLNLFYLPFWLAATITGWSAFRHRLGKISLENILLAFALMVLFLSSRIGTLSFLLVIAFLVIYFNFNLAKRLQAWSLKYYDRFPPFLIRIAHTIIPLLIFFVFLGVYFLSAVILVFGLSHFDPRLANIFAIKSLATLKLFSSNIYNLSAHLSFAERVVYWAAGWNVFNLHPLLGVGLGNAGFFFPQTLPAYGWTLPEVMNLYYRGFTIPNIKSFWVRLLAETGIIGFSSFIAWYYVMVKSSWVIRLTKTPIFKTIGWAGLFVLIAFLFEGFSTDTFALPYLWISLGIVSAVGALLRNSVEMTSPQ